MVRLPSRAGNRTCTPNTFQACLTSVIETHLSPPLFLIGNLADIHQFRVRDSFAVPHDGGYVEWFNNHDIYQDISHIKPDQMPIRYLDAGAEIISWVITSSSAP